MPAYERTRLMDPRFSDHLHVLKKDLLAAARPLLRDFTYRTGVCPRSVRFTMVESTTHGDALSKYELAGVKVEFDL